MPNVLVPSGSRVLAPWYGVSIPDFGTETLAYKTYELNMQTQGELPGSSSSSTDGQGRPKLAHRPSQLIDLTRVSRVLKPLFKTRANLRLRTKLLLWLVLFSAAPPSAPPLLWRHSPHAHGHRQNEQDAPHALPTLPTPQHH